MIGEITIFLRNRFHHIESEYHRSYAPQPRTGNNALATAEKALNRKIQSVTLAASTAV